MWLRRAFDRRRSTTGPHGSLPAALTHEPATTCPSARTRRPSSCARRVFPIPGSPVTNKRCAPPSREVLHASLSWFNSSSRPTKGDSATVPGPRPALCAVPLLGRACEPGAVGRRPRSPRRSDRKLALEHLREPVHARSAAARFLREMCFHLNSNGRFVGRLQVDDAGLGISSAGFVVVAPCSCFYQPHEGPICLGSKFRSLVEDPVVIASWKEIARIETRGALEITGRQRIAELSTSTSAGPVRIQRTVSLSISTNSPVSGRE